MKAEMVLGATPGHCPDRRRDDVCGAAPQRISGGASWRGGRRRCAEGRPLGERGVGGKPLEDPSLGDPVTAYRYKVINAQAYVLTTRYRP
jgi:hypothetical protein